MNDVIYEAEVRKDLYPNDSGCGCLLVLIVFLAGFIAAFRFVGVILDIVIGYFVISSLLRRKRKITKQGILQRVVLTGKYVMLRYGHESLETKAPRSVQIPLEEITEAEVDGSTVILHTAHKAYQLEGLDNEKQFAIELRRAQQKRGIYVPASKFQPDAAPAVRLLQHTERQVLLPQSKPAVDPDAQNAMEHMLRTGAITQAQFDTANDPHRPLPPQPAVDADTFHALEYQLQTGMITREEFDAMAYCQQKPVPEPQNVPAADDAQDADEQNALAYQQRMQQFGAMMPPENPDEQGRMQI